MLAKNLVVLNFPLSREYIFCWISHNFNFFKPGVQTCMLQAKCFLKVVDFIYLFIALPGNIFFLKYN